MRHSNTHPPTIMDQFPTISLLCSERSYNIPLLPALAVNEWLALTVEFIVSLVGCFTFDTATTEPPGNTRACEIIAIYISFVDMVVAVMYQREIIYRRSFN